MAEKDIEKGDVENAAEPSRESSISTFLNSPKNHDQDEADTNPGHYQNTDNTAEVNEKQAAASVKSSEGQPARPVARSERRGFLARFALLPEVDEPKNYSRRTKWTITFIVAFAGAAAPAGSGILLLSNSIGMFIVMRMLNGGASGSVQAVGAGTIADIWEVRERGRAMGIFYLGPLCGPLLSPIIGGALNERWGWRSTQWFCVIYGGIVWLGVLFGLPETLKNRKSITQAGADRPSLQRTTTRESVQIKTKKWLVILRRFFVDPLRIILTLRFGAVALTVWLASTTFFCLYFLNISVQQVFGSPPYGFSSIIVGLLYIPNSLGYIFASIFGGRWVDYIMRREAERAERKDEKGRLIFLPEDRMRENAWFAAVLFPVSMIWYGWTAQKSVMWIVPVS
ncbi:MAG: hypothetical protein Q9165_006360 [Trypethelium subeluteriae]